jgi:tetratricopeptide (TPR) repeat protein
LSLPRGLDFNERLRKEVEESLRRSGRLVAINFPEGTRYIDRATFNPIQEAYYQARELMHREEWPKAAEALRKVIELGPEQQSLPSMYTLLGLIYARARNSAAAVEAFTEALKLDENAPFAHLFMGTSLMLLHRYEEAVGPLRKALELQPELTHVHFYLGHIHNELERYEEAAAAYEAEIAAHPQTAEAYKELARLYVRLGDDSGERERYYLKAIETYEKWTEQQPKDSVTFNLIGYLYGELGRFEEAAEAYQKALDADTGNVIALSNLGTAYLALGRTDEAKKIFERVTGEGEAAVRERLVKFSTNPDETARLYMAEIFQKLGASLLKIHQGSQPEEGRDPKLLERAEEAFNSALRYVPDDLYSLHGLGLVYFAMGRRAAAVRLLRKVLEMDPGNEDASNNLRIAEDEMARVRHWVATKGYQRMQQGTEENPVYAEDVLGAVTEGLLELYKSASDTNWEDYFTQDDLLQALLELAGEITSDEARADLALVSVIRGMLSPAQAAQLADMNLVQFLAFIDARGASLVKLVTLTAEYEREYLEPSIEALAMLTEMHPDAERPREELQTLTELRLDLRLRELGLLKEVKKPVTDFTPYQNRTLITVQGRPVSETLLEDRE